MNWKQKKKLLRAVATIFAIMFIISFAFVSCGSSEKSEVTCEQEEYQRIKYCGVELYEVGPFETLSHIAVKYIPSDKYMQQWIEDVQRLNGRNNSTIYSGEVIKVYVCEEWK